MNLHENTKLFADAVLAAAQYLQIKPLYVEKDYWITRTLKLLSQSDSEKRAIFKGGTSLSKAHHIGARFSEDIDLAIVDANSLSGNQRKMLIKRLAKSMTEGLEEIDTPGVTSKGSSYYKSIYGYSRLAEVDDAALGDKAPVRLGQIMVEINSFANPSPLVPCEIDNFIREFLHATGNHGLIEQYGMQTFELNVLDKKRTATEKIVSLLRFSLAADYKMELAKKIRHFYDLYCLMEDGECADYIYTDEFITDLKLLLEHDRGLFDNPDGWNKRSIADSPLFDNIMEMWNMKLAQVYSSELSSLAYRSIPEPELVIKNILSILNRIRVIGI